MGCSSACAHIITRSRAQVSGVDRGSSLPRQSIRQESALFGRWFHRRLGLWWRHRVWWWRSWGRATSDVVCAATHDVGLITENGEEGGE